MLIDGKAIYNATGEYIAEAARMLVNNGVTIIGVSGGATPDITATIAATVKGLTTRAPVIKTKTNRPEAITADYTDRRPEFLKNIAAGKFITTAELDIPRGLDMTSVIDGAAYLKAHGIDAVNITDGARARLRMNSIAISVLVQNATGMECITHLACRDRNLVALQSDLLGAWSHGVKNILVITGYRAHIGDSLCDTVYDVDAIGLIRAVALMNKGEDIVGNPIGAPTAFSISCAANPLADDFERELVRLAQKSNKARR